ncbi:MAG: hypothetical protein NTY09_07905 [bacterium]|nr:hypothetical protein [bacterium]
MYSRLALMALLFALLIGATIFINFNLDDPFITFRYADNIALGEGPVYNPGERVEGYSNPTWVLIMTLFSLVLKGQHPLAMLWIAKALGILAAAGTVLLVYFAERRAIPDRLPFASIFLALNPCFWVWSVGGLETSFSSLLFALLLYGEVAGAVSWISPLAMGLIAVTRPEMPFLLPFYFIWRRYLKKNRSPFIVRDFLLAAGPFIAYLLFRLSFFGDLLPNTYYAKASSLDIVGGAQYLFVSIAWFTMLFSMVPLLLTGLIAGRRPGRQISLILLGAYTVFIVASGGDWMPAARFLIHVAPLIAWVIADGLDRFARLFRSRYVILFIVFPLMIIGGFPAAQRIHAQFGISPWVWERLSWESPVYSHYLQMGEWLLRNASREDYLATGEAGLIPYVGQVRLVDCFGLMDKHIARLPGKIHYKFDESYVLARRPRYILLLGEISEDGLKSRFLYCRVLLRSPSFTRDYTLAYNVRDLWLFKRKDTQ